MIIDTGNRTDVPAFYSEWYMKRIREGYVMVRNPYSPEQVTRYRLDPDSPFLIGNSMPLDRVHDADQYSYIKDQVEMEI